MKGRRKLSKVELTSRHLQDDDTKPDVDSIGPRDGFSVESQYQLRVGRNLRHRPGPCPRCKSEMNLMKSVQAVDFFFRCSRPRCQGATYIVNGSPAQPGTRQKIDASKVKFWWPSPRAARQEPMMALEAIEAQMFLRMDGNTYLHGVGPKSHWVTLTPSVTGTATCNVCGVRGGVSHISRQDEDG